ncbi:MAG: TIGR01212 family radical SAM protein [Dethiobacteria bacterium]
MPSPGWYYRLSRFFKETFGEKVYKIPLDAGFSCPNRDGTISTGGCIFCYNPSFSPAALDSEKKGRTLSVTEQIRSFQLRAEKKAEKFEARRKAHEELQKHKGYKAHEMQAAKTAESSCPARYDKVTPWEGSCPVSRSTESSRKAAQRDPETTGNSCSRRQSGAPAAPADAKNFQPRRKYLAYFQAYSNTYAPLPHLQKLYEEALSAPGIIGLSIATRPDCLGPGVLELLQSYAQKYHIWLELGLQSSSDRTLRLINRGHTYHDFEQAVLESSNRGIYICAHLINGLPGEGRAEMLETIAKINSLPLHGVKFHQLQVFRGTPLARLYEKGEVPLLSLRDYLEILCDQLELLRGDIVVHRLLSEAASEELLIAPRWDIGRSRFSQLVEGELKARGSWQGKMRAAKGESAR